MNYKLIPRFYYTLSTTAFLKAVLGQKTNAPSAFLNNFYDCSDYVYLNSGRACLRVLLSALSNKNLKVGVQAYTCHTVLQAIKKAGHTLVFLDINKDFHLDLGYLKKKIKELDVLIVTHTFGFPEKVEEIKEIAKEKIVIEDCAHSFLSRQKNQLTGTLFDAAIFSTGVGKFPPIGAGGYLMVNAPETFPLLQCELAKIKQPGFLSSVKSLVKTFVISVLMKPPLYGLFTFKFGKRLDSKLDFINKNTFSEKANYPWANRMLHQGLNTAIKMKELQAKNAQFLTALIKNKSIIKKQAHYDDPNFYALPLIVENRDEVFNLLLENNIEAGKHFHKSLVWASSYGYKAGTCPNTELMAERILTVPVHYGVSVKQIRKIAYIINKHARD